MNPIEIFWPSIAESESYIVSEQAVTSGVALTLNANTSLPDSSIGVQGSPGNLVPPYADGPRYGVIPNTGTGAQALAYEMPVGNIRSLSITAASGSLGGTEFDVIGLDQNNTLMSVTGTPGEVEAYFFKTIVSVTPQETLASGNTVQIGLGADGFISLLKMDTWNKNNNYTISYSESAASIELIPYYSLFKIGKSYASMYEYPALYYALPISNANIIVSPSSVTTLPVTQSASFSVVGIPLTGLSTKVVNSTGSFYQIVIQQGGLV